MKYIPFSLLILLLIGCGNKEAYMYYDDPPPRRFYSRNFNVTEMQQEKKIDILWVIDNSGSMGDIQNNIVQNAALFMDNFTKSSLKIEWKMGLMSTDVSEAPYLGFSTPFDWTNTTPVSTFQSSVQSLGTWGDASEYVFKNVHRAFDFVNPPPAGSPPGTKPEYQFFRENAHLVVIMVTDEEAQSQGRYGTLYEPTNFINAIRGLMDSDKVLRFYGAFQFKDMKNCNGSNWDPAYKGSPFEQVIMNTNGFAISACESDFGKGLASIGKDIMGILRLPRILLGDVPKTDTIKVFYKDEELKGGLRSEGAFWYYDEYYNRINFYSMDFMPDDDLSDIRVDFEIEDGVQRDS